MGSNIMSIRFLSVVLLIFCIVIRTYGQSVLSEKDSLYLERIEEELYTAISINLTTYLIHQDIIKHSDEYRKGLYIHGLVRKNSTPILSCTANERYAFQFQYAPPALVSNEYLKKYILIEYTWPMEGIEYEFRGEKRFSSPVNNPRSTPLSRKGLVGVDPTDSTLIIFISGHMFLDNICQLYFPDGYFSANAMQEYINLRYYNYDPLIKEVDVLSRTCLFYSKVMKKKYQVHFIQESDGAYIIYDEIEEVLEVPEEK